MFSWVYMLGFGGVWWLCLCVLLTSVDFLLLFLCSWPLFLPPPRPPPVPHPGRLSGVVVTETLSRPRARPVPEQQLARQGEEGKDGECVCPTVLHHYLSVCLSVSMS